MRRLLPECLVGPLVLLDLLPLEDRLDLSHQSHLEDPLRQLLNRLPRRAVLEVRLRLEVQLDPLHRSLPECLALLEDRSDLLHQCSRVVLLDLLHRLNLANLEDQLDQLRRSPPECLVLLEVQLDRCFPVALLDLLRRLNLALLEDQLDLLHR